MQAFYVVTTDRPALSGGGPDFSAFAPERGTATRDAIA